VTPVPDHDLVTTLIERVVMDSRIPSRAAREDLRRELWTHFEEAGTSADAVRDAIRRFGGEAVVAGSFRSVYRWDYFCVYLGKVAVSLVACVLAALLIQVIASLSVAVWTAGWPLAPRFSRAAGVSVAVVLGLIAAWEMGRPPFNRARASAALGGYIAVCVLGWLLFGNSIRGFITATLLVGIGYLCASLECRPSRLLILFGAFAATLYINHLGLSVAFGPGRALAGSAALVAVWSSTVVILARFDAAFMRRFESGNGT
jgi:hypothetical protein